MKHAILLSYFTLWLFASCSTKGNEQPEMRAEENLSKITYIITENVTGGYGYEIFDHRKRVIAQPYMPGVVGQNPFTDKKHAAETAKLVIRKIKDDVFPPGVSKAELDSLLAL